MARIRTYQLDENLSTSDYLLGNDGDNGSVITKRFSIEDLKEFINEDIPLAQQLPPGYISATDQQGDSFERSPIQVQHTNAPGPHVFFDGMSIAGFDIFYLTLSNGQQVFRFENYNEPFYLPSFVGKSFTFQGSRRYRQYLYWNNSKLSRISTRRYSYIWSNERGF